MKINIVIGNNDKNWILWDMAEYIKQYNSGLEIEISADPLPDYDVYHINNDEMFDRQDIPWHRALYTCHQFERDNKRRTFWAREGAIRNSRRIGCVCKEYMEMLEKQGIPPEKIYYTPAGVDVDKFVPAYTLKNSDEKYVIGYVGRKYASGRKGEDLLREILLLLPTDQYKIIFLGTGREQEVEFCQEIGLECEYYQRGINIEYEDYPTIYQNFDCLLVTSREEGGPVPVLEALACGIPVFTTPVGITKDVYRYSNCSFYTQAIDGATIIERQRRGIEEDLKLNSGEVDRDIFERQYAASKDNIRSSIMDLPYTWERWAQIHRKIYEDIYEEIKDQILIEDYMHPQQMQHISRKYSEMAKEQIDPNHLTNFLQIQDEAKKGQGILGTKNIFENKPAIIVGFGPSLDKHLDLLKEYQSNFVIAACDAAFSALYQYGIHPDFVFVGDWTEKQAYNFREGGEKRGKTIDLNEQNVVLPTIVHPKVIAEINKSPDCPVFWYNVYDPGSQLMQTIPNIIGKKGGLVAGVLTTGMCYSFVAGMGCSPIIFIGHDLYYPINEGKMQGYSQYASEEKKKYQEQSKFRMDLMTFPDINRNMVITHLTFASFYAWINYALSIHPKNVINASECGILHGEKIKQMNFSEVCLEFGKENIMEEKKYKTRNSWHYNTVEELIF